MVKMYKNLPICIKKYVEPNEHLTINYMVTGDGES